LRIVPSTFEALAVVVLGLLPGALFTWAYERQVGSWGIARTDRLLRFIGGSIAFQVLAAPLTYWLYSKYWASSIIRHGGPLPLWLWGVLAGYALVPYLVGDQMGRSARRDGPINKVFAAPNPAPRAWDHVFTSNPRGWVRVKMTSGPWLGGLFLSNSAAPEPKKPREAGEWLGDLWQLSTSRAARRERAARKVDATTKKRMSNAYAAAYPETQDIYLPYVVAVDPETGDLMRDDQGQPQIRTAGLLLKWEAIEYIELTPFDLWP
jgi:hypothetical protein